MIKFLYGDWFGIALSIVIFVFLLKLMFWLLLTWAMPIIILGVVIFSWIKASRDSKVTKEKDNYE